MRSAARNVRGKLTSPNSLVRCVTVMFGGCVRACACACVCFVPGKEENTRIAPCSVSVVVVVVRAVPSAVACAHINIILQSIARARTGEKRVLAESGGGGGPECI